MLPAADTAALRVRLASPLADGEGELPFRILVIADLAGRRLPAPLGQRRPIVLGSGGVAAARAALRPGVRCLVPDRLSGAGQLGIDVSWSDHPGPREADLVAQVPELSALDRRRRSLLAQPRPSARRVEADAEAALLAARMAAQVAVIRDCPEVRRVESAWHGVELLAGHAPPGGGVEVAVLAATREELDEDLADAPEPAATGLHRTVYAEEYGQHGGRPWALLVSDLACARDPRDLALLRRLTALAALAHAPLLADAAPGLLGLAAWRDLADVTDVQAALAAPGLAAFHAWRAHPDARHAALALPPWPARAAAEAGGEPLWGPAAVAVAARLADCHVRHRWCALAAGDGPEAEVALPTLPAFPAVAGAETQPPTACLLTEVQARELAAEGLIAVCASRRRPAACLPQMPTLHLGERLPAQLPLVLLADRIAHHLKVLTRERLGGLVDRAGLERELAAWLSAHTADGGLHDQALRAARPLRRAEVRVHEVPGRAGWMQADLRLCPWLPGAAGDVELALAGRLDRGSR